MFLTAKRGFLLCFATLLLFCSKLRVGAVLFGLFPAVFSLLCAVRVETSVFWPELNFL